MPALDLVDDSYVACRPEDLAPMVAAPGFASALWPGWILTVTEERGCEGVRWSVGGPVTGSAEVWLERYRDRGCYLHVFARVDPVDRIWTPKAARRNTDRVRRRVKRAVWDLKDRAEATHGEETWRAGPVE
ncbi:hypothetical protein [Actinorhabdospora filicis]|uniref:hypothetical protein n=1 Tax=Actinorhabdospora filicis TaxID=1785913 RepID=UPI002552EF18|nr:hypothetical protein [Actinorhabdospora filicis]